MKTPTVSRQCYLYSSWLWDEMQVCLLVFCIVCIVLIADGTIAMALGIGIAYLAMGTGAIAVKYGKGRYRQAPVVNDKGEYIQYVSAYPVFPSLGVMVTVFAVVFISGVVVSVSVWSWRPLAVALIVACGVVGTLTLPAIHRAWATRKR